MDNKQTKEKNLTNSTESAEFTELQQYLGSEELENAKSTTNEKDAIRYKLEGMLPDYLFNRLSDTEKEFFEVGVINYPDLTKELDEAQKLFARIEEFDFGKMLKDKSQYLPDKVVERLAKRNELYTPKKLKFKWLIAAGMMAAILMLYINFSVEDSNLSTNNEVLDNVFNEVTEPNFFTSLEKEYIYENIISNEFSAKEIDTYSTDDDIEELLLDISPDVNYMIITEMIEEIDEYEFQELMTELE